MSLSLMSTCWSMQMVGVKGIQVKKENPTHVLCTTYSNTKNSANSPTTANSPPNSITSFSRRNSASYNPSENVSKTKYGGSKFFPSHRLISWRTFLKFP